MESGSKGALIVEAPPGYSASPKLPGVSCKKLLIVVVVVVVIVLVVLGFLLLGLHITEKHTEAVLQMTIQGSKQHLSMSRKERMATFHVGTANSSATLVYDYSNLLIGYRSWPGGSCYILRMSKENIQSLDAAIRVFQHIKEPKHLVALLKKGKEEVEGLPVPLVDRSTLGTTINILCSSVPIYWV